MAQWLADEIKNSGGDKQAIWYAQKCAKLDLEYLYNMPDDHVSKSAITYRRGLRRLARQLYEGDMARTLFIAQASELMETEYKRAYRQGLRDVDVPADNLEAFGGWQALLDEDVAFLPRLARFIVDTAQNGKPISDVLSRLELWVNNYERLYPAGMTDGASTSPPLLFPLPIPMPSKRVKLQWRYGETEHCRDCLELNNRVYYADMWDKARKRGVFPRSRQLACKGYNCKCRLYVVDDDTPITKGRIPNLLGFLANDIAGRN